MDTFDSVRDNILQFSNDILLLLSKIKTIPHMDDYTFGSWEDMCHRIGKQISEEILRVAVVGPIKSGKSTFVNALLSGII